MAKKSKKKSTKSASRKKATTKSASKKKATKKAPAKKATFLSKMKSMFGGL